MTYTNIHNTTCSTPTDTACIEHDGKSIKGYKKQRYKGGETSAHRIVCAERHDLDVFDQSWVARHTCHNPRCVNPDHLIPGTHADNVADRVAANRSARGEAHGRSSMSELMIRSIKCACGAGVSVRRVAAAAGCSASTVQRIKKGEVWGHITRVTHIPLDVALAEARTTAQMVTERLQHL